MTTYYNNAQIDGIQITYSAMRDDGVEKQIFSPGYVPNRNDSITLDLCANGNEHYRFIKPAGEESGHLTNGSDPEACHARLEHLEDMFFMPIHGKIAEGLLLTVAQTTGIAIPKYARP
jgi:hypothetical protein